MNMPAPCLRFTQINCVLENIISDMCEDSMVTAVVEAIADNDPLDENDSGHVRTDLVVSCDGTFMKRGHMSLCGVSSVVSIETGKLLDVQVMSKFCHNYALSGECEEAVKGHNCSKTFSGSSGGMEGAGMQIIFKRSVKECGVRYVEYLGDGDSNVFKSVNERKLYGELSIEKLECIGHIQKRMGSRLRKLVSDMKG
ncbi:uncharacterized protein LOC124616773 [Schistocerca americana]|uniref:uncharacterized protein LOC124616773 n=1 Tax=Schistocerca americana TaxID=7009 RepID=UPI001F4F70D4|nr:uncharacterized protein LOC124616773 [Schistocerca americana]